ncbi:unnamed protein product [Arabidopsis lyrata]|uniref:Predicted protein n=1 Tax=Arabidopsis lyrata subsp. lyrata TaxID=81972 RepID=D7KAK5_ARALL|nr:predicted protein [Arabidopsis lyrata subsp. lyrata]CAH8253609.1 unnamed protein product [Arabidopsis lyrata]
MAKGIESVSPHERFSRTFDTKHNTKAEEQWPEPKLHSNKIQPQNRQKPHKKIEINYQSRNQHHHPHIRTHSDKHHRPPRQTRSGSSMVERDSDKTAIENESKAKRNLTQEVDRARQLKLRKL